MRIFIGDTETTGIDAGRQAVDLALIEVDESMNVLGEAQALLKPTCPIGAEAMAVHGITEEMVAGCPTLNEWMMDTFGGQIEGESCLIGYRVAFDLPMIQPLFESKLRIFDMLPMVQQMFPELENHKLQTIREHLGIEGGTAHRAMGDVLTTHQLMLQLIPKSGRTLRAHLNTPFQMMHTQPWGKHKGVLLVNLPSGYRKWLLDLPDLDPNLRRSLEIIRSTDYQF